MSSWNSADEARRNIDRQVADVQARAKRATALRQQMDQLRTVGRSRNGEVSAEVDVTGRLMGITFEQEALRLSPQALEMAVMQAVREASLVSARQAGALAEEAFGEESDLARRVRAEADSRVVGPPPGDAEIRWR